MCIIGKGIEIAKKDIEVWKVLRATGFPIFKHTLVLLSIQIKVTAFQFDEGFGFSCFESKELADKYKVIIEGRNPTFFYLKNRQLKVKKYIIPKGSKYEKGRILDNLFGGGMKAIRTERLSEKIS